MTVEFSELLKQIGRFLEEAERWGNFCKTLFGTDKEDLAPYFARLAGSAYIKADSLSKQLIFDRFDGICYHISDGKHLQCGWYAWNRRTLEEIGPFASSSEAMTAHDKL